MNTSNLKTLICDQCGKIFTNKNPKTSLFQHKNWCDKKVKFLKTYNLTNQIIQKEYDRLGSVLSFKEHYPFWDNFIHYYRLFKELEIDYSLKLSSSNSATRAKTEKTNIQRYGERHNFCKDTASRKKWEKKLFDEEGITNVFQREEVKIKSLKTLLDKYGTEVWKHKATVRGMNVVSNLNKKVFEILQSLNIGFEIELKILTKKSYYAYDIILNNSNKIIEVNGDYWHGNPEVYRANDIILKNTSDECFVSEKWEKDSKKIQHAINNGYTVLVLWEKEIKTNIENVINKIINYANSKN